MKLMKYEFLAWPSYPGSLPVDSSLGSGGSGGSGTSSGGGSTHPASTSSFEPTPYPSPMGSASAASAAAAAYYSGADRKHLAFWPNEYKYGVGAECGGAAAAFGAAAQGWCNYPYAPRVPSHHMEAHGGYLNPASISAVAAAAEQERREAQPSFHDSYGALRNPYGAELAASPYPPPGKKSHHLTASSFHTHFLHRLPG